MKVIKLSDKQKEVVNFEKGPLLVTASAGSGKTRVLTERICRLAQTTKRKILAITFTNKASSEIKERLTKIDEDLLEKVTVGTFHSFCNQVLTNHGFRIGYDTLPDVLNDNEDKNIIADRVLSETPSLNNFYQDLDRNQKKDRINKLLELVSKIKRNALTDNDIVSKFAEDDIIFIKNYNEYLSSSNLVDYDDLLYLTFKLFLTNPTIASLYARNYEYVLVDEAQDLNRVQYMLLYAMMHDTNHNIMMVGDPNQSIYGFTDSSAKYMMENFVEDFSPSYFELTENYRSTKAVLEYANEIIPNSADLTNIVLTGKCTERSFKNPDDEAKWVVEEIMQLISKEYVDDIEDKISYESFCVLARNKYILAPIEKYLKENSIPYYYKSSKNNLEMVSDAGIAFQYALLVYSNPKDTYHLNKLKKVYQIESSGCGLIDLIPQLDETHILRTIIKNLSTLKEDCSNFKSILNNIKEHISQNYTSENSEEYASAEADFNEILSHWKEYAKRNANRSISGFRNAVSLGITSQHSDNIGIALSTVHTMKGQESDIVFLIGMDDQTFPDYRALRKGGIELKQEKNNLYVAITRAKRYLYISYPRYRIMPWGDTKKRNRSSLLPL